MSNHATWIFVSQYFNVGVQRIAVCPFTSSVGKITLESPSMMHAFTLTGLETYTLKTGHCTVLEAEVMDNKTKTCPNAEIPVCLVGLRPFVGKESIENIKRSEPFSKSLISLQKFKKSSPQIPTWFCSPKVKLNLKKPKQNGLCTIYVYQLLWLCTKI